MKKSTKAALISALVLPVAGHLSLKRYATGCTLIAVSITALYYLISKTAEQALKIVEIAQSNNTPLDVAALTKLAEQQAAGADSQFLNSIPTIMFLCWMIGIIDSYRVGLAQEKAESLNKGKAKKETT